MNFVLLSNQNTQESTDAVRFVIESLGLQGASAAFIASEPDVERIFFNEVQDFYGSLEVDLDTYIDFEDGFDEALMDEVMEKPIIHMSGGNTYRFLHSLKSRGLQERLVEYAQSGGLLIGVSAGALLLTQTIEPAEFCGDVNDVGLDDFSALGLIDFMFIPHATKDQDEFDWASELVEEKQMGLYLCEDTEGIVILNDEVQVFGDPVLLSPES